MYAIVKSCLIALSGRPGRGLLAFVAATVGWPACAGVIMDGTTGPSGALAGPNFAIKASQGRIAGTNLFHSFAAFGLTAGEIATFSNDTPSSISNVIGRVTGGTPSSIDGTIRSTIEGASLYLLNPAGILFARNAALDLRGSFYASTATYLRFGDGSRFAVAAGASPQISAAAPAAFGFSAPGPATISVQGATLEVPAGKTLGLIGGDISLEARTTEANLRAPGGAIVLGSIRGPGEAIAGAGSVDVGGAGALGAISIRSNATLDASAGGAVAGGGRIFIRGGRIAIENSALDAHTGIGNSHGIDIAATESFSMSGGNIIAVTNGTGNAGEIRIQAPSIVISNGALIDTSCDPGCTSGNGGAISITASGGLSIVGTGTSPQTAIVSNSFGNGDAGSLALAGDSVSATNFALIQSVSAGGARGKPGSIAITGNQVDLSGGSQFDSSTNGTGAGGAVKVAGAALVTISGTNRDGGAPVPSGVFANTGSAAAAGAIQISTASLRVESGGEISSSSQAGASGAGGSVRIAATSVSVSGADPGGKRSGIFTNAFGRGDAGVIEIDAATMRVSGGGLIQSQSQGAGRASDIVLNLGNLALSSGGQLSVDAHATGAGGTLRVSADGSVVAGGAESGIFAQTYAGAPGGSVRIVAGSVELNDGAKISARSLGTGLAGNVGVDAGASLKLDGGEISTQAVLSDGGNITVSARDLIYLRDSQITTKVGFGLGNGGNIRIDPTFMVLNHSSIIADAFGGNGGNISIVANNFFMSPDSLVRASSQLGISGTIQISSPVIDLSGNLVVLASGFLDAGALLASRCAARFAGKASSLVLAGHGGFPTSPDGLISLGPVGPPSNPSAQGLPAIASRLGLEPMVTGDAKPKCL